MGERPRLLSMDMAHTTDDEAALKPRRPASAFLGPRPDGGWVPGCGRGGIGATNFGGFVACEQAGSGPRL
jgi:hypothetical protein